MPKRISSIKPRGDSRRGRKQQENSKKWYVSFFARLIFMAVLICIAVNIRIYYNQRAELLNREIVQIDQQIHELDREIENLKKRKEELCSFSNIIKRNRVDNLGLRYASPNQVRNVVLVRRDPNAVPMASVNVKEKQNSPKTASIR